MVAIGGWIFNAQPMALVRALIRKGARDLRLMPAPGSIAPDLLIGAGCVSSTSCLFISFEQYGLAPHFRRRAENGTLQVSDIDGPGIMAGLRAAICDLPYMPIPDLGTDLPKYAPSQYRTLPTEPGERKLLASMAIRPDVCLVHAQQADEHGNVQHVGPPFLDTLLAQASRRVIVSVDRIVSTQTVRRNNHLTKLPSSMVDAVVEAPYGAHPTASPSLYRADEAHLKEYVRACASAEGFAAYTGRYVQAASHTDYLNAIGGGRLAGIAASETNLTL
ncbi:CoA transferase subunit A [Variovorax defluvii]|uniref:CoA transferase subunit A n=2 Tax=Variovorax defluvii TaxID=913761 RepID=A0ABP8IHZ3_9BURK